MDIGDEMLIHLHNGTDERENGSGWRRGLFIDWGRLISGEPLIVLDDGGPPIGITDVEFARVITHPLISTDAG